MYQQFGHRTCSPIDDLKNAVEDLAIFGLPSSKTVIVVCTGELVGELPDHRLRSASPLAQHAYVVATNWSPPQLALELHRRGLEVVAWLIAGHSLWDDRHFRWFAAASTPDIPMVVFSCRGRLDPACCLVLGAKAVSWHVNTFVCGRELPTDTWAAADMLADVALCVPAPSIAQVWRPLFRGVPALRPFRCLGDITGTERAAIKADLEATRLRELKKAPKKLSWAERCELLDDAGLGHVEPETLRKRFRAQL